VLKSIRLRAARSALIGGRSARSIVTFRRPR
jgi:hypothetical protein